MLIINRDRDGCSRVVDNQYSSQIIVWLTDLVRPGWAVIVARQYSLAMSQQTNN